MSALTFLLVQESSRGAEVRVTEYGAVTDSRTNAVRAVQRALDACRTVAHPVLVFPRGRYDFWPQGCVEKEYFESNTTANNPKRLGIFVEKFNGLEIDAGGSTFVFHDRMQPFTVDHSAGVTFRNCSIDWDIPLTAEALVAAATAEYLDLRIDHQQFPYTIDGGKMVSLAKAGRVRGGIPWNSTAGRCESFQGQATPDAWVAAGNSTGRRNWSPDMSDSIDDLIGGLRQGTSLF